MKQDIKNVKEIPISSIIIEKRRDDMGDLKGLMQSIERVGIINPVIVDKNLNLIQGLRRIEALKLLGATSVPAAFFEELSPYERRAIELEEQLLHQQLTWQEETRLKEELHKFYVKERASLGSDESNKSQFLESTDKKKKTWTQEDTANLLGMKKTTLSEELRLAEALRQFPELKNEKRKSQAIRKMYRLREFAILSELARRRAVTHAIDLKHGDAFSLIKEIPDNSIDLIITDPPYGIDLAPVRSMTSFRYRSFLDVDDTIYRRIAPELFRVLKDGHHLWIFFPIERYNSIYGDLKNAGFDIADMPCIWVKESSVYGNWEHKPLLQYEAFFFAVKNLGKSPLRLKESTSNVFNYTRDRTGRIGITEKPVELLKRLILLSSEFGDSIFDPFAGSGTTLIAALMTQRRGLGFEIDQEIYSYAAGRLSSLKTTLDKGETIRQQFEQKIKSEESKTQN